MLTMTTFTSTNYVHEAFHSFHSFIKCHEISPTHSPWHETGYKMIFKSYENSDQRFISTKQRQDIICTCWWCLFRSYSSMRGKNTQCTRETCYFTLPHSLRWHANSLFNYNNNNIYIIEMSCATSFLTNNNNNIVKKA